MSETSEVQVPAALRGLRIVDADTHISEWGDLWTSRAPAKYKDRVPQRRTVDGKYSWYIEGDKDLGLFSASSAVRKDGFKCQGFEFLEWPVEQAHAGAWNVTERVKVMDQEGIRAQIAYPNVLGFGGQKSGLVESEIRLISTQIYNDAMAEMQAESGNRVFPMALLPWWDVKEAVAEAKRCQKMGMRGVNINSDPQLHGLPSLDQTHWDPLWEACCADNLPVNFHIGASDSSMTFSSTGHWFDMLSNKALAFTSVSLFMSNARVLNNIFLSGWLERFPTLKLVSVESGVGWIPFVLEALEYEFKETGLKFKATPQETFRRQVYACSWFESRNIVEDARRLGVDNVLFETDYPHPTSLYPRSLSQVAEAAARFTPEERVKVFGENAVKVYNLPPA
jgi:predicted TIM-barrel fold metal-dependent hydrolase